MAIDDINDLQRNDLEGAKALFLNTRKRLGRDPKPEWVRSLILLQDDATELLAWLDGLG